MSLAVEVTKENFKEVPLVIRRAMLRQLKDLGPDEGFTVVAGGLDYKVTGQVIQHHLKGKIVNGR